MDRDTDLKNSAAKEKLGKVIFYLLKENHLTKENINYARRIQKKLQPPKPLLEVLKELEYVNDDKITQAIKANRDSLKVGTLLVELGHITRKDLDDALRIQYEGGGKKKIGDILIDNRAIDEKSLVEMLSLQMGFPFLEPEFLELDPDLFQQVPYKLFMQNKFIPIKKEGEKILVAFSDPLHKPTIDSARGIFKKEIVIAISKKDSIDFAIQKMIREQNKDKKPLTMDDESIVGIVNTIIINAIRAKASDIHIEPMHDRFRVRLRIDGILHHIKDYSKDIMPLIASRIKILTQLDIAEKRRHQGGRIDFQFGEYKVDLRVSTYVTVHGEKIVFRIINKMDKLLRVEDLGMPPRMLDSFITRALNAPSGVTIVTGPTGSGKTSTVYSCIDFLNTPEISIITAEDPVEYVIDGIGQCSINEKLNLTFEETLRHIVRQDPDIIVIGEIRDFFSADVAVQAALTGHQVLSTFHTEDSIGALVRLVNMKVEPFLISSTINCVLAQRLLRKICPNCRKKYTPGPTEMKLLGYHGGELSGGTFYKGEGCSHCRHSGYSGRIAVHEMLLPDEHVRDAVLKNATSHELRQISINSTGLVTLFESGIYKASKGITTIEEILRCLPRLVPPRPLAEVKRLLGG
ncbi:MAG: Flp pilus assembly complex ATPase component TadA [Proteobacteria bacterium]|nr:Flp pilus assembly complex ATPase component TadA [Pseudomonadota bacterium]MBU1585022.1 Flp pilus assembly complex ATPase component TadA [Pseudomonadota bacterium]MBU2630113.1 Flp pilus assembly complex ATPase component TadA [Pseudomonadota bacterium]